MTKPITATAAMMLVEDGTLRLDDPVDALLPELANRRVLTQLDAELSDTVPATRAITVEDLLTFRNGFGILLVPGGRYPIQHAIAELGLVGFGPPDPHIPGDPDQWLHALGTLPLMAQPGERWLYNVGSNILGILVARASGQSFPAFLQSRIFGPLGMHDTGFFAPPEKCDRLADAYRTRDGALVRYDGGPEGAWTKAPDFPEGGGGLVSTVDDVLAFSRFWLRGGCFGERRLLARASVDAMTRDHLTSAQRKDGENILTPNHGWGYGVSIVLDTTAEGISAGAYGWNGGLGTSWVADPTSGITAILMTQTMFQSPDPPTVHKEFWSAVFG
jgi:CubicO group peptidase (beta-lactamase class C family)